MATLAATHDPNVKQLRDLLEAELGDEYEIFTRWKDPAARALEIIIEGPEEISPDFYSSLLPDGFHPPHMWWGFGHQEDYPFSDDPTVNRIVQHV